MQCKTGLRAVGSFIEILKQFRATFVYKLCTDLWNIIQGRIQNNSEHIINFYQDKVRIYRELNLALEDIKGYVIQG